MALRIWFENRQLVYFWSYNCDECSLH